MDSFFYRTLDFVASMLCLPNQPGPSYVLERELRLSALTKSISKKKNINKKRNKERKESRNDERPGRWLNMNVR